MSSNINHHILVSPEGVVTQESTMRTLRGLRG
jgi:hypothetical protein